MAMMSFIYSPKLSNDICQVIISEAKVRARGSEHQFELITRTKNNSGTIENIREILYWD